MSEAKDSIANLSTNQQEPYRETQKVESLDNIETEQQETADKVKPTAFSSPDIVQTNVAGGHVLG